MSKPKALVTAQYNPAALEKLIEKFDVTYSSWMEKGKAYTSDELIEMVADKELIILETDEFKSEVVTAAKKLKIVACCRGLQGDDNTIDVAALTKRGIPVLYAPGRNLNAAAEFTILMTLVLLKKVKASTKWLYNNKWQSWLDFYTTFRTYELAGKKVGLLGFGNIGKRVAKLFNAFGATVYAYDPFIDDEAVYRSNDAIKTDLETVLKTCDIVSLHMNAREDSKGFIDADKLKLMKPNAYLINSARAVLVNHDALYDALAHGRLAGAAIDVFHKEPATTLNEPLLCMDNVFATPHMAGTTEEIIDNHSEIISSCIEDLLAGKSPKYILNPEVLLNGKDVQFD